LKEGPRTGLTAAGAAVVAFLAATGAETLYIRLAHADRAALEWISDVLLSLGFGLVAWLWLHLKATRGELARLERARIVLDTELALAAEIQRNLLPATPAPTGGLSIAARMEPAGKIGGDFYDFLSPDPETVVFVLGDISGKGVPAALLMASTRTLFRNLVRETQEPAALATRLSRALHEDNGGAPYATCVMGRFDMRKRTLTYVNAGHPAGLVVGPLGRRAIESCGPPVGILPSIAYLATTVPLAPGDVGVLVTDGITEAAEGTEIGASDLLDQALRTLGSPPRADEVCQAIMSLTRGLGPAPAGAPDDRTVLAFVVSESAR
jgi:sigma-B regulation protein RsbU (phosphoserine phosphatase)